MGKVRHGMMFAILAVAIGATAVFAAAPTPADMLRFQPKQNGLTISTPADAELANCKVELVNGPGAASGWMLKDARGLPVRKFVASKGAKASIDVWSYYLDGQEVYREFDTTGKGKPDQYRWFGAGGMRWGVDVNQDGRIDGWKMISAEEVSQEALKAIATRDVARFQVLLVNANELKSLQLAPAEDARIRQSVGQAAAKFGQTVQTLANVGEKANWKHLDVQAPQCIPADQAGAQLDLIRYKNATIFYENGDKHDFISIGELIQVGQAWRLVAGPAPGGGGADIDPGTGPNVPDAAKPILETMQKLDKNAPQVGAAATAIAAYNMQRAALLEQIIGVVPAKDNESFVKQMADCLSTAAQNVGAKEKAPQMRLVALKDSLVKAFPAGHPLIGYVEFRVISAEYSTKLAAAPANDVVKVQDWWRDELKKFVTAYPTAEDAPEATIQVAMVSEFMGKETEAKNWYAQVVKNFGQNPVAAKAAGALKRLGLDGQVLELAGPTFNGQQYNIAQARGKTVVAFYWASWNNSAAADLIKLKEIYKTLAPKGVELVTINLDDQQQAGAKMLADIPGQHIYAAGGLNGKHANDYGIMVLPNIFLVGPDGKVVSRTAQMSGLEEEIKKLLEK